MSLFDTYPLNEDGAAAHGQVGHSFEDLLSTLAHHFGMPAAGAPNAGAREWALVKTKLEEACFYARRCVALQPKFQK